MVGPFTSDCGGRKGGGLGRWVKGMVEGEEGDREGVRRGEGWTMDEEVVEGWG